MKHFPILLNTILIGVLIFAMVMFVLPESRVQASPVTQPRAQSDPDFCDASRTVHVSGAAMVNVVPDRALIQLGVQSNGKTPTKVQEANSEAIEKVIRALKKLDIESKDIATDWYVVEPIYENYDSLYIKGYRINNVVAITLRDVSKASQVIVEALEAGANQVINVELYTSELRKYRDQARQEAMIAASEKAQALAQAVGSNSGCALNISENTWSYYNGWWSANNANLWAQNTIQNASQGNSASPNGEAEPVSLGQISVRAEVSVTFALK